MGACKDADPVNGQWSALSKCTEDEWGRQAVFQRFSVLRVIWGSRGSENFSGLKRSNWGAIQQVPRYIIHDGNNSGLMRWMLVHGTKYERTSYGTSKDNSM